MFIGISLISFLVSLGLTPLVKRLALHLELVDKPGTRKIHVGVIPRMGGLGIFGGMVGGLTFFCIISPDLFREIFFERKYLYIIIGSIFMLITGLVDDKRGLDAKVKFSIQFLVAAFVIYNGLRIERITNPFGDSFELGWLSYPITFLWIVGITNAINLSDGLDGLAGGIALITSVTMFAVALILGNKPGLMIMTAALSGAILGFLRYNFNPAQIFMGDTGSLFIGFLLATVSIKGALISSTTVSILIPLIAMGLPIFDTLFAIVRRLLTGKNPFSADREHVHHRLLSIGLTQRQTVIILYATCIVFGLIAFAFTAAQNEMAASLLLIFGVIVYVGIQRLGYIETILVKLKHDRYRHKKKIYKALYHEENPQELPLWFKLYSWKTLFELALDVILVFTALSLTRLVFEGYEEIAARPEVYRNQVIIVILCCLASFYLMGYYRALWRYINLDSIGKYVKGVIVGTLVSYFALTFIDPDLWVSARHFLVFGLFLLVTVSASRLLFNFYNTYAKRELTKAGGGERVLIYGAGDRGEVVLSAMIKEDVLNYKPIGFIDDNPVKLNREILGYSVLGNINRLDEIVVANRIQRIVISSPFVNGNRESVLKDICRKHNVQLCHFKIQFDSIPIDA